MKNSIQARRFWASAIEHEGGSALQRQCISHAHFHEPCIKICLNTARLRIFNSEFGLGKR
ncbi:hypothetical protein FDUTEX481_09219 [Tolypothrix sp. PCC 7601]|nr:hypothetical protein FDUTEX481_09219 [Tolypothrix sp. PCC 7601]